LGRTSSGNEFPILGTWRIKGHQHAYPGIVTLQDSKLTLRLYIELNDPTFRFARNITQHPVLAPFCWPNRPTILGDTNQAGKVTLLQCVESHHQATVQPEKSRVELCLLISEAWAGADFIDPSESYQEISFVTPGLHNILSQTDVKPEWPKRAQGDRPEQEVHPIPDQAFLIYHGQKPSIEIRNADKTFRITFSTSIKYKSSSTDGVQFGTVDFVRIGTDGATPEEMVEVVRQVEQFISLLCLGPFGCGSIALQFGITSTAELIWSLSRERNRTAFTRMPHETLLQMGRDASPVMAALRGWFQASESTQQARWLIFDALFEETSSTAKFLSVVLAWEIIGRDETSLGSHDKQLYAEACDAARIALEKSLDASTAARLHQLLKSSNRKSLTDFLKTIISKMPPQAVSLICGDTDVFVGLVVKVRNILTHMQEKKDLSIEKASRLSIYLTYKLIALFCIHYAITLGLPTDNLATLLANNEYCRAALRPLPNLRG
jgi:hypothetical protein